MAEPQRDLARIVLAVLFIGGLIAASFWVLRPFLGALIWAVMIVIPTWPLMLYAQKLCGGRRWAAVTVVSVLLLLVLLVPLFGAIGTVIGHADDIAALAKRIRDFSLPPPPAWLAGVPLVGEWLVARWQDTAAQGVGALAADATPYIGEVTRWFLAQMGTVGALFIQFVLTVIIAAGLYAHGEAAADAAMRFGARLAGETGESAIQLSAQAIRGVALGVVVTALLQAVIGGVGLAIAGVPFALVLTALMFLLAVAQIGAAPVLVVAVIWLYWGGSSGWGTFLLVVTVFTATIDNVVRPILIRRGADLPLALIFAGVIGGIVGFGLIGIFVGPVVLAVGYTLLEAWLGLPATPQQRS